MRKAITLESNQDKKQRTNTINEAKKIKSNKITRGKREKSNIAFAILKKIIIEWHYNYLYFGGTNDICAQQGSILLF